MSNTQSPFAKQVLVDDQNPWPGLVSFTEEASAYFFGRGEEKAELFRLVVRESLSVVFGQSGLGKTSLLQAGLFPELRRANFLPVYVRLNHAVEAPPLAEQVLQALAEAALRAGARVRKAEPGESLWAYFQSQDTVVTDPTGVILTPVLVIDQMEEIFTLGRRTAERSRALLEEVECLVENRAPPTVQAMLVADPAGFERFDFERRAFRLVLSLREDFLPELEALRNRLRGIAQNRFRLQRMNGRQALTVALEAGHGLIDAAAARLVVENLGTEGGPDDADLGRRVIEPALLSVVLRELNFRRQREGAAAINPEMVTVAQDILRDFYNDKMGDVPPAVRATLEDAVLSDSGRFRVQAALDDLAAAGVSTDLVEQLVNRRILRYDERYGARVVELTHDRLVPVVQESRLRRAQEKKDREATAALQETARQALEKIQEAQRSYERARLLWREFLDTGATQTDDWRFSRLAEIEDVLAGAVALNPALTEASAMLADVRRVFVEAAIRTKDLNLASIYLQKLQTGGGGGQGAQDLAAELAQSWAAVDPARNENVRRLRTVCLKGAWLALIWGIALMIFSLANDYDMSLYVALTSMLVMMGASYCAVQAALVSLGDGAAVERVNSIAGVTLLLSIPALNPFTAVVAIIALSCIDHITSGGLYWSQSQLKEKRRTGGAKSQTDELARKFAAAGWEKLLAQAASLTRLKEVSTICLYLNGMILFAVTVFTAVDLVRGYSANPLPYRLGALLSLNPAVLLVTWALWGTLFRFLRKFRQREIPELDKLLAGFPRLLGLGILLPLLAGVGWSYYLSLFDKGGIGGLELGALQRIPLRCLLPCLLVNLFLYAVLRAHLRPARAELAALGTRG